jgi:RNA polymerase sigma factor (sigma-70 family)
MASKNIQELAESFIKTLSEKDFVELYKRIKPGLLNHCKSILTKPEFVEDAVSNTMAKIWTKISQYDPERGNFSTWVYNIARNESLVIKKIEGRYFPLIQETSGDCGETEKNYSEINPVIKLETENFSPFDCFDTPEKEMENLHNSVLEKMRDLPVIYKEILFDREILHMKYQEIAEKHGMKKRAVATRIRRARLKVRDMFPNTKINFND